jgi:hypothetical protein
MNRHASTLALLAGLGLTTVWGLHAHQAQAEKPRRAAKLDLTPNTFAKLHRLIRPHEDEWRHLKVHWLTDVVAARKKAAAEDKPILICYTGGAGYNEPLGTC